MNREANLVSILSSFAQFQKNISYIVGAKAVEAEKMRSWLLLNVAPTRYQTHEDQVKESLELHGNIVELIDAMTKMEHAIAKNLEVILGDQDSKESLGMGGDFGNLFGGFGMNGDKK